jgi:cytidylate kinase-like protein
VADRVVCLSGLDGAQMRDVARGVAAKLKFAVVDEEIVLQAASAADLDPEVISDSERRRTFVERAIGGFGAGADASAVALAGAGYTAGMGLGEDIGALLVQAIEETADRGKVVIAAHAASHALADRPDVVRVLITASPETRRARVAEERGLDDKGAAKAIENSDKARADYLKRFYRTKRELPTQYDLVVNTDRLTPDEAVKLVVLAARS